MTHNILRHTSVHLIAGIMARQLFTRGGYDDSYVRYI